MQHEDGYCDRCGAEIADGALQLTVEGHAVCAGCVASAVQRYSASKPEARDDGR